MTYYAVMINSLPYSLEFLHDIYTVCMYVHQGELLMIELSFINVNRNAFHV